MKRNASRTYKGYRLSKDPLTGWWRITWPGPPAVTVRSKTLKTAKARIDRGDAPRQFTTVDPFGRRNPAAKPKRSSKKIGHYKVQVHPRANGPFVVVSQRVGNKQTPMGWREYKTAVGAMQAYKRMTSNADVHRFIMRNS